MQRTERSFEKNGCPTLVLALVLVHAYCIVQTPQISTHTISHILFFVFKVIPAICIVYTCMSVSDICIIPCSMYSRVGRFLSLDLTDALDLACLKTKIEMCWAGFELISYNMYNFMEF